MKHTMAKMWLWDVVYLFVPLLPMLLSQMKHTRKGSSNETYIGKGCIIKHDSVIPCCDQGLVLVLIMGPSNQNLIN